MATRKPALSTQLKNALARIAELEEKVESEERSAKWAGERANKAEAEIEDVHAFLDAVPGAISKEGEQYGPKRSAMTRLAAWLATKQ